MIYFIEMFTIYGKLRDKVVHVSMACGKQ